MTDWPQLVEQHGTMVWRTAIRLVTNEPDAADCFQRTFVSALELERKETVRNWPGLLRRLATIRALECLRQRRREANRQTTLPATGITDVKGSDPLETAELRELAEDLRNALAALDERQAQVFCLACLDNLSYAEIAEQMGVTENHVGVLLNRARTALRERLQGHRPATTAGRSGKGLSHDRS